jgi:hypothetical protein
MKIDKKKFIEAWAYLRQINQTPIEELDLTDFGYELIDKRVSREDWKFTGLNNTHYIENSYPEIFDEMEAKNG